MDVDQIRLLAIDRALDINKTNINVNQANAPITVKDVLKDADKIYRFIFKGEDDEAV
jgi:hypothetical protein